MSKMLNKKPSLKEAVNLAHHNQWQLKRRELGKDQRQRRSCSSVKVAAENLQNIFGGDGVQQCQNLCSSQQGQLEQLEMKNVLYPQA